MKNIHIVYETRIPEDGEQYSKIIGVFAYKPDATKFIKSSMIEWALDNEFTVDSKKQSLESLKGILYGRTREWSPQGKFWMRPRWSITSHKLTPKSKKK